MIMENILLFLGGLFAIYLLRKLIFPLIGFGICAWLIWFALSNADFSGIKGVALNFKDILKSPADIQSPYSQIAQDLQSNNPLAQKIAALINKQPPYNANTGYSATAKQYQAIPQSINMNSGYETTQPIPKNTSQNVQLKQRRDYIKSSDFCVYGSVVDASKKFLTSTPSNEITLCYDGCIYNTYQVSTKQTTSATQKDRFGRVTQIPRVEVSGTWVSSQYGCAKLPTINITAIKNK